jgi:hypothetical protein
MSVLREQLQVEPLHECIEKTQLRWFGYYVGWMITDNLSKPLKQDQKEGRREEDQE